MFLNRNIFLTFGLMVCVAFFSCKKENSTNVKATAINVGSSQRLNNILVKDNLVIVVGGRRFDQCTILRSTDGGKNFSVIDLPQVGKSLYGILEHQGTIVALGFDGKWLTSTDDGATWHLKQLHYEPLKDAGFFSDNEALVVSGISYQNGKTMLVNEHGELKTPIDSFGFEFYDLEIINHQEALASVAGGVVRTMDKGITWQFTEVKNDYFTALDMLGNHIWTCGSAGTIFRSDDGGHTWTKQRNGNALNQSNIRLNDIMFMSESVGIAVGDDGVVLFSDDQGKNWQQINRFTEYHLRQIKKLNSNQAIACGDNGGVWIIELP